VCKVKQPGSGYFKLYGGKVFCFFVTLKRANALNRWELNTWTEI